VPGKFSKLIFACLIAVAAAVAGAAQSSQPPAAPGQAAPQTPAGAAPAAAPPPAAPAPAQAAPEPPSPPQKTLNVVIIDPAHGGADAGARGSTGIVESDLVLSFARLLRISLEAQGLRVLLTRQANDGPSFDDRSKLANAQRNGVFITLHVSSTGQPGTVRVYSLPRPSGPQNAAFSPRGALLPWDRAQFGFLDQSRRLAELIQIQMAQRFHGSPETPLEAPVRQLRTVGAPAVAIEVSSVSVADRSTLDQMGPGLADGVARAVAAFRTIYEGGGR
jgi:N-acetylmuramoyl-L-alanine amidase